MKRIFTPFRNIALHYFPVLGTIKRETLVNEPGNEMWRVGRGYNKYRPFIRIDWGSTAWRWTFTVDYHSDFWQNLYPKLDEENRAEVMEYSSEYTAQGLANPDDIEMVVVCRGGGMIVRERPDHWEKVWIKAKQKIRDK